LGPDVEVHRTGLAREGGVRVGRRRLRDLHRARIAGSRAAGYRSGAHHGSRDADAAAAPMCFTRRADGWYLSAPGMGKRSREKRLRREEAPPRPARPAPAPAHTARAAPAKPPAEPAEPPAPWTTLWREHGVAVMTLFGIALLVRVLLLLQIAHTPYVEVA